MKHIIIDRKDEERTKHLENQVAPSMGLISTFTDIYALNGTGEWPSGFQPSLASLGFNIRNFYC